LIGRNTLVNLVGLGLPLAVAFFAVPPLVVGLGDARFGLLTLIWAIVSYFGLLDLGLGRALTRAVAAADAEERSGSVPTMVSAAVVLMGAIGLAGGLLLLGSGPLLLRQMEGNSDPVETTRALVALSVAVPAIVVTAGLRGVMEARGAFVTLNVIRVPFGIVTFAGPLAVLLAIGPRLDAIAWVLAGFRIIGMLVHAWFAWRLIRADLNGRPIRLEFGEIPAMLRIGSWMTLSNIVSPFMGYVDRFMIGAMIGAGAVAYYSTPNELITKLWIVPSALTAVLFPYFSRIQFGDADTGWAGLVRGVRWLFAGLLPATLALNLFAHEMLGAWINPAFASQSAGALEIFAFGMLINCLAHVPITMLQAYGRARSVALLHLAELPFFLGALWVGITTMGIEGAAIAWFGRMAIDAAALFVMASRASGRPALAIVGPRTILTGAACLIGFVFGPALPIDARMLLLGAGLIPAAITAIGWRTARRGRGVVTTQPGAR